MKKKKEQNIEVTIERIGNVRKMIVEKHKKEIDNNIDVTGEMECPYCKGKIRYGMANSVNGHIHAFCENKCVGWIE